MRRALCVLGLFVAMLGLPITASAAEYQPLTNDACKAGGGASQSAACADGAKIDGNDGVLRKVASIIALLAGIAAVIIIIIGGLQYVFSAGDAQKAASARSAIIGGVVGLVIVASAQGILLFVLSKL